MKKILLLITILCCISIFTVSAQNYVVHRQRDNVTATKEHLSFEGIPINGNQRDFFNSLKKKGYEVMVEENEGEYYRSAEGKFANIDGWVIFADKNIENLESIYQIRLFNTDFANVSGMINKYKQTKQYIESHYDVSNKEYLREKNLYTGDTETIYKIDEKGIITISCDNSEEGLYINICFKDYENNIKFGERQDIKKYSIANVSTNFQKCFIESSQDEIKYDILCNNKFYTFISREQDVQLIRQVLEGNYDDKMKLFVIASYVNEGLSYCKNMKEIPIIKDEGYKFFNKYVEAAKKVRRETTQTFTPRDAILEYLRQKIFSPSERQTLDRVIPPDMMRGLIGGTINFMGAGKEGYYTDYEKYINPYAHD